MGLSINDYHLVQITFFSNELRLPAALELIDGGLTLGGPPSACELVAMAEEEGFEPPRPFRV
jgi:hypothetical protein